MVDSRACASRTDRSVSRTPGYLRKKNTLRATLEGIKTVAPNGTPTDLVIRNDDYKPLFDESLLHADLVQGSPIPLVKPEYLAAMKMVACRGKIPCAFSLSIQK